MRETEATLKVNEDIANAREESETEWGLEIAPGCHKILDVLVYKGLCSRQTRLLGAYP